ncbi:hypothetical protein [Lujinxingia litoralis]|uniref:hypothetical protein n=1 Tax=Lujinxingia litoralis TaxID=2211119 RepID=UPI0011B945A0|nr:hypothetical protein [Lujinxingia litoralis]
MARAPDALAPEPLPETGFDAPDFAAGFNPNRAFKSERSGLLLFVDKSVPPASLSGYAPRHTGVTDARME